MDPSNAQRAEWARESVEFFMELTGMDTAGEELYTGLSDLLVNIRHLCKIEGIDYIALDLDAAAVFVEELAEEEGEDEIENQSET